MEIPVLFRDLQAGIIAGQLIENGYFDEAFEYHGFSYVEQNKLKYFISTDEDLAYKTAVQFIRNGLVASPVVNFSRRLPINKEDKPMIEQRLMEEFRQQITETFPLSWFAFLTVFAKMPNQRTALPLLQEYKTSLRDRWNEEQKKAFSGLVSLAKMAKSLDTVSVQSLLNDFEEPELPENDGILSRSFFGFAYCKHITNSWQYYINVNRSSIYTKKYQLMQQNVLSTPIFEQVYLLKNSNHSIPGLKRDYEILLKQIFDLNYFTVLQKLQEQPPAIDTEKFKRQKQKIIAQIHPAAKAALEGYEFLWHLQ